MLADPSPKTTVAPADPDGESSDGRSRLLDVAAASLLERGYDGTSLRHIATAANMQAGSVYYHFRSKDDLFEAVLRRGIEVMNIAFDGATQSCESAPAPTRIECHVRAHLAALFENGPYTAAHVTTFRTAPAPVRAAVVQLRDRYEARWATLLQHMQQAGDIDQHVDLTLARLALFGAMNSAVEWFDRSRGSLDRFATAITGQFWNGVAA